MSGIYIKDLDKKNNIDGTESILIQDSNGTKQLDINTLLNNNNNNADIDLSDYATKNDLNNKADKAHTHTTSDITGLAIPTVDVNKAYVDSQLSLKANVSEVPTKTSDLTNDSGFIESIPSEYVTETELNAKGYLTSHQDISMKADKSEIPSLEGYATETFVTNKIAEASLSGEEVDLSGYATKDELNVKADISSIPTKTSQLTNDSGFLTSHQDISGKADKI